jgi:sterol desaturase/sphingolipid hydroxylase (fatty acid hydroxylase superfamily)
MNLLDGFALAQQWLFETAVEPAMYRIGLGNLLEDGYAATGWLLVGIVQIALMATLLRLLERWRPVEPVVDRAAVREDIVYTLIHRLGAFRLLTYFAVDPLVFAFAGDVRQAGWSVLALDALVPGVTDRAWISFAIYLLVFDFVDYAIHRAQHGVRWWWKLHALHHSQRQMTLWSDSRNHLVDDLLRDAIFALAALAVGVPPEQFVAVVALRQLVESLSHANLRLGFGPWLGRVLVGPRYHRLHHAIGAGDATGAAGRVGDCNFAVLFPLWDLLFRSACFDDRYPATGIRDQLEGRDYGRGFWAQQWLGLKRLAGR